MSKSSTSSDIIKLVIRHDTIIETVSQIMIDAINVLWPLLPKCNICENAPMTMRHSKLPDKLFCDKCCSQKIYEERENPNISNPNTWIEHEHAPSIRRINDMLDKAREIGSLNKEEKLQS